MKIFKLPRIRTDDLLSLIIFILAMVVSLLIIFAAPGCSPAKRMARIAASHPAAAAVVCDRLYPVKESTRVEVRTQIDTVTVPGTTIVVDCDSARRSTPDSVRVLVNVPCPPVQLITKMVTKDSIVYAESTARVQAVTAERDKLQGELQNVKKWRNRWMWIAIIAGGYLLLKSIARVVFPSFTFLKYLL